MLCLFSMLAAERLLREGFLIHNMRLCYMRCLGLCVHSKYGMNARLVETANRSRDGAGGVAGGLCLETLCKHAVMWGLPSMMWLHVSGCDIFAPRSCEDSGGGLTLGSQAPCVA